MAYRVIEILERPALENLYEILRVPGVFRTFANSQLKRKKQVLDEEADLSKNY